MAKLRMFVVYDSKAEIYNTPFCMNTVGAALRAFADQANDPSTMIGKYPTDYDIFEIGTFDDNSGKIEAHEARAHLAKAQDFVKEQSELWPVKQNGSRPPNSPDSPE